MTRPATRATHTADVSIPAQAKPLVETVPTHPSEAPDPAETPSAPTAAAPDPALDSDNSSFPARARRKITQARRTITAALRTRTALDAAVCLAYTIIAGWLTHGLWPDPATRALAHNVNDQALIEWFLAHGTLLWTGDFSLVTDRLNAPDGVNLMSNASHILHGALMAPVTAVFSAAVSFAVLVAVNLAATAAGWYLFFARTLRLHRGAALIGGAIAGFAPGMVSQSNSHLHITAQWLVPAIIASVVRLTRITSAKSVVKTGVGLGALITAQLLLGEEVLFLTALTLSLFAIAYSIRQLGWVRRVAPRFLAGAALAAGLALLACAYPLWTQFAGRQHTPNAPFGAAFFYADLASFTAISPLSLAGAEASAKLASSAAEFNTFLGLPLLIVVGVGALWRWRAPTTMATVVAGLVMAWLSLGPTVTSHGHKTGWPSLYHHIAHVPVVDGALPTRYALALIPLIALLLAQTIDHAVRAGRARGVGPATRTGRVLRVAVPVVVIAALIPIAPTPLATTDRTPVPTFISSGAWRQCVPDGGVLVPVPLPTPLQPDVMRWAAQADDRFAIPQGFFIGPYGPGGLSSIGTYPRPTSQLLAEVARTGVVPPITSRIRRQASADLAYWRADCVALAPGANATALRQTLDLLLGPGQRVADTWTWPIP